MFSSSGKTRELSIYVIVCPRSLGPFSIVSNYINWEKISGTEMTKGRDSGIYNGIYIYLERQYWRKRE